MSETVLVETHFSSKHGYGFGERVHLQPMCECQRGEWYCNHTDLCSAALNRLPRANHWDPVGWQVSSRGGRRGSGRQHPRPCKLERGRQGVMEILDGCTSSSTEISEAIKLGHAELALKYLPARKARERKERASNVRRGFTVAGGSRTLSRRPVGFTDRSMRSNQVHEDHDARTSPALLADSSSEQHHYSPYPIIETTPELAPHLQDSTTQNGSQPVSFSGPFIDPLFELRDVDIFPLGEYGSMPWSAE